MSYRSVNSNVNKNQNNIYESINNIKNNNNTLNLIHFKKLLDKKSINQFKINTERNGMKKTGMNSPVPRRIDDHFKKNNITEFNNYSFLLNKKDINKLGNFFSYNKSNINNVDDEQNYKKINKKFYNGQYNNTYINSVSNLKIKNISNKHRLIELNKYYLNNPNLVSNSSFRNVSPESNK